MEFKYSMSILFSHMGYIFKIFVWILISMLITVALGAAILIPLWNVIAQTTEAAIIAGGIKSAILSMVDGSMSVRSAINTVLPQFVDALKAIGQNPGAAVGLAFAVLFLYTVYCFVIGLSYYTVSDIVNNIMASNMRYGFASSMAMNLKKCFKYSVARLGVSLPIDILILAVMCALVFGLFPIIGFFSLPLVIAVAIIILSLRAVLFSGWLPRMLYHPEEKVYTNLTRSFTFVKYNFRGLFKAFLITFALIYLLFSAFAVPTGGLIFLVLPSTYYFVLRTIELVGYYKTHGFSFYTDATTVINTVEYGYRSDNQKDVAQDRQDDAFTDNE